MGEMSEPLSDKSRVKHVIKHLPSRWNNTTELVVDKILAKQFSEIRADEAERCAKLLDYWARYGQPLCRNLAREIRARHAKGAARAKGNDSDNNGAL